MPQPTMQKEKPLYLRMDPWLARGAKLDEYDWLPDLRSGSKFQQARLSRLWLLQYEQLMLWML